MQCGLLTSFGSMQASGGKVVESGHFLVFALWGLWNRVGEQGELGLGLASGLDIVPISTMVMKLTGVVHSSLLEVDGFHHLVVFNGYFNKLLVAKLTMNKKAITIDQLLYKLMCRNGCFSIQKEFGNKITRWFYCLTCVQQRIKSVYHLQIIVERQLRLPKFSH